MELSSKNQAEYAYETKLAKEMPVSKLYLTVKRSFDFIAALL